MFNKLVIKKRDVYQVSFWESLASPIVALLITLLISSSLLLALGYSPIIVFHSFFIEPLSSLYEFSEVIMKATVLIIIALGLAIGFRANVWNIGAEGQFIFGAITGSVVPLTFDKLASIYVIPLMIIIGGLGGILWAAIPAFLKNRFGTNEILSSLMLVYIAQLLLSYAVYGPLQDPNGLNFPQSAYFSEAAIFPYIIEGTRLSITPLILLLILPLVYLLLTRSYLGFQLQVTGFSPIASSYSGFNTKKMVWVSFLICGALSGIAGISEVSTNISQLVPTISPGYGFTAIIVAFLGRLKPLGIVFAGFLMALIYIGAEAAQITLGLPTSIAGIFQGLILFSLLGVDFFTNYKIEKRNN